MNLNSRASKYYGKTKAEIKQMWEKNGQEKSQMGIQLHKIIEDWYENLIDPDYTTSLELVQFKAFKEYMHEGGFLSFRTEWKMLTDESLFLVGTADMFFIHQSILNQKVLPPDETLHLHLMDWKRSQEIKTKSWGGARGFPPCEQFEDCNFRHYQLALNLYKYILENFYRDIRVNGLVYKFIRVDTMDLVVFHPNLGDTFRLVSIEDCQPTILRMIEIRRREINAQVTQDNDVLLAALKQAEAQRPPTRHA